MTGETHHGGVSPEQAASFREHGYLVLPGFADVATVDSLRRRGEQLLRDFKPEAHPSVFSTTRQAETSDAYFLASANNTSFFLEEGALSPEGQLTRPKHLCVNKFGHAMHDLDDVFAPWSRSAAVRDVLVSLGMPHPVPMQSMYITKQPSIGGVVVPHQDSCFLHTEPDTCVGIWLALQDATRHNGCLWAIPGSHTAGVAGRFVLTPDRKTQWVGGKPPAYEAFSDAGDTAYIPLEASAGTLVVLHGAVVHASAANTSQDSRHAYSVHYVDKASTWAPTNWLQRDPSFPPVPL